MNCVTYFLKVLNVFKKHILQIGLLVTPLFKQMFCVKLIRKVLFASFPLNILESPAEF